MGIKDRYNQARKDFEYLIAHHEGYPYDMTGGFVEGDKFIDLMKNPTKANASYIYESLIEYSGQVGFEKSGEITVKPDMDDDEVCAIYERHFVDVW